MSDSELGGVRTPVSSGASSASTVTTTGSTAGTTPKLKLTFKLAEIRAASPAPSGISNTGTTAVGEGEPANISQAAVGASSTTRKPRRPTKKDITSPALPPPTGASSFVTPYKKARKETASTGGTTVGQPPSREINPSPSTSVASTSPGGASSRVQFPEQITFVREMRKLRARRWRRESTTVPLLGGRSLVLPCWARDRPIVASGTGGSPKVHVTEDSSTFAPTFVCTWEGCHKIFDAKDKWRRHLNLHRRKERKAAAAIVEGRKETTEETDTASHRASTVGGNLQLKLNLGNLLRKASSAMSVTDTVTESPAPSSSALDDVDIS